MNDSSSRGGRLARVLALLSAAYAGTLSLLMAIAILTPGDDAWFRALDLEDLFWTIPAAGLAAVIAGTVALVRSRARRKSTIVAMLIGGLGIIVFGLILAALLAAAGLLDQL